MNMKKILVLCLVCVICLTGCGKSDDTLIMVTEAGFAPYEYYDDGEIVGVDIDIAREIAKEIGYKLKIHADEIESLGGAELAAKLGCVSADHLMAASDEGIKMMAENNVVANILPATSFNLNKNYADCRKMIDMGAIVSLSSDYNPGSCPSENLQLVMQLGCLHLKMTPNEVLTAVTINAAYAIDRADKIGSIEVGKNADFVVFDARNVEYLMYHFGINHTKKVYKNGNLVVDNKVVVYDK